MAIVLINVYNHAFLQEQKEVLYICTFYNLFNSQHLEGCATEMKLNVLLFSVTCSKRNVTCCQLTCLFEKNII